MNTSRLITRRLISVCALGFALLGISACDQVADRVGSKIEQAMPKATAEQEAQVDAVFQALQRGDLAWVKAHADPILLAEFEKNPNTLPFLAQQLPKEAPSGAKQLVNITQSVQTGSGKMLSLTYQYSYPVELVLLTVTFDNSEAGSLNIKGLGVNKQANPNATPPASAPQLTPPSVPQPSSQAV